MTGNFAFACAYSATRQSIKVAHACNSRAGVIMLEASVRVGTIRGREQIEGGNYSRKYGNI